MVVGYLYFLVPANSHLVDRRRSDLLQAQLKDLQSVIKGGESTRLQFEKSTKALMSLKAGTYWARIVTMALYDSLNVLIRKRIA